MVTGNAVDTKARIQAANKALGKALAAGDSKGIAAMYTKTALVMPPNAPAYKGQKAIAGFWQSALDMGVRGATLRTTEVDAHGATAVEVGAYRLTGANAAVLDVGKYIVVWKREGGVWKLHRDIYNSSNKPI